MAARDADNVPFLECEKSRKKYRIFRNYICFLGVAVYVFIVIFFTSFRHLMSEFQPHVQPNNEVLHRFRVNAENGLASADVARLRAEFGANELPPPKETPAWLQFLKEFNDPVIYILIVAGIVNGIVAEPKDAIVIAFVVLLNTIVGFVQERRAEAALKALRGFAPPTARVMRGGEHIEIPTNEIVCGDILLVESGTRVAADARLVSSLSLQVDESMLTGESLAATKNDEFIADEHAPLGDRVNMLFSGTIVQRGRGTAVVTGVGAATEFGKISKHIEEADAGASPLQARLEQFSKYLSIAIMVTVGVIFLIGWLRGNPIMTMLLTAVGLAVSAIPEGLPVSVTITLSIGMHLMAKRNAVIRKLVAVETLGSANVICSDKTGTLTRNQMTATRIYTGGDDMSVSGGGYSKRGAITFAEREQKTDDHASLAWTIRIGTLCTESRITDAAPDNPNGEFTIIGDPTEAALLVLAHKARLEEPSWDVWVDLPFESERQSMAVNIRRAAAKANGQDEYYACVKGSVERILARCRTMLAANGSEQVLSADAIHVLVERYAAQGLRVLCLAYKQTERRLLPEELADAEDLIFAGLVGIMDPPREDAKRAIADCHHAGIRVVMITGDHATTAQAIASELHLAEGREPVALAGRELEIMSDDELSKRVLATDVYARVSPTDKLRIVKSLQAHGNVVAMTGDGVNDAPALKQADIGVAMGGGTDVAKDVSSMVILDNNFVSIAEAVRRGRVIFNNLQHIILYILTTSFGGVLTLASAVVFGIPLPVLPAQLLWINLVTDGTSTFPLAFEKEHGDAMRSRPRPKNAPLIPRPMLWRIVLCGMVMMLGTLGMFYYSHIVCGHPLLKSQTIAFCTLALFQIWNVQNSRSLERSLFFNLPSRHEGRRLERIKFSDNPQLLGVMVLAALMQILVVSVPHVDALLSTPYALSLTEWAQITVVSLSVIVVVELSKIVTAVGKYLRTRKARKK